MGPLGHQWAFYIFSNNRRLDKDMNMKISIDLRSKMAKKYLGVEIWLRNRIITPFLWVSRDPSVRRNFSRGTNAHSFRAPLPALVTELVSIKGVGNSTPCFFYTRRILHRKKWLILHQRILHHFFAFCQKNISFFCIEFSWCKNTHFLENSTPGDFYTKTK